MAGNEKEKISSVELWAAMCLFITSTSTVAPIGAPAGPQSWIAIIIAVVIGLAFAWVYTFLSDIHSGKSVLEIGELLLGKWGGKIIGLLYAWYSLESTSFMMKDNWQLTRTVALPNTPLIVISTVAVLFVLWISYAGIEAIGRLSIIFVPILAIYLVIAFILLSKDFDFRNFLPLADIKWRKVLYSSLQVSILPLSLSSLFMMIFPSYNKKGKALKPSLLAVGSAGLLMLFSNIIYLLVLGPLASKLTNPGYTAFSYIQVADFIDRAEIMVYTLFIVMSIIAISINLYVPALCLAKVFGINNYRMLLVPLGFLALELSTFIVPNHAVHIGIVVYSWPWYAMIYHFIIPLLLLIVSAVRKKRRQTA